MPAVIFQRRHDRFFSVCHGKQECLQLSSREDMTGMLMYDKVHSNACVYLPEMTWQVC